MLQQIEPYAMNRPQPPEEWAEERRHWPANVDDSVRYAIMDEAHTYRDQTRVGSLDTDPLARADRRLADLARLEDDWDSYGAAPIAPEAIKIAAHLMRRVLMHRPYPPGFAGPYFVGPIPYGGIEIEWRNCDKRVEIDVRPDGSLDVLIVTGTGASTKREARQDVPVMDALRLIEDTLEKSPRDDL
ncbi:MAG: hypothetical protein M3176_14435 [Chloroflexota bacterium]|nr:hypothetical protein [Chloroflexota bacterium]MDQ6908017.1 hypothetical protein [Chloroflexota bacterium]